MMKIALSLLGIVAALVVAVASFFIRDSGAISWLIFAAGLSGVLTTAITLAITKREAESRNREIDRLQTEIADARAAGSEAKAATETAKGIAFILSN